MGSLKVGHDWATSLSLFTFMHWRRTWKPTPVFLPGESQGQGSLVGCHLWGCTESDTKLEVVKQEMARMNVDILGISKLKWTGMGKFNSDDHYIYYCGQESLRRNGVAIMVNKRVRNAVLG